MDRLIEIKINGSHLTKDNLYAGVQGEANVTALRIEFDESWDGYLKTVVFWDAKGENPVKSILNADMLEDAANSRVYRCMIPAEPLAEAGECTIVVDGYVEGKRPRTIPVKLKVRPAPDSENAAEPTDPAPSQAAQLQAQIDTIKDQYKGVMDAIENIPVGAGTPIVNNLVTGGTTMALSAEMGKVLKNETVSKAGDVMTGNLIIKNYLAFGKARVQDYSLGETHFSLEDRTNPNLRRFLLIKDQTATGKSTALQFVEADGSNYQIDTVLHTGNMAQYIGVAQASLEE